MPWSSSATVSMDKEIGGGYCSQVGVIHSIQDAPKQLFGIGKIEFYWTMAVVLLLMHPESEIIQVQPILNKKIQHGHTGGIGI